MEQFKKYEELYFYLNYNELRHTENKTGCLHPCSYNEYQIADKQVHYGVQDGVGLFISYGTLAVTVKREVQQMIIFNENIFIHCIVKSNDTGAMTQL